MGSLSTQEKRDIRSFEERKAQRGVPERPAIRSFEERKPQRGTVPRSKTRRGPAR